MNESLVVAVLAVATIIIVAVEAFRAGAISLLQVGVLLLAIGLLLLVL